MVEMEVEEVEEVEMEIQLEALIYFIHVGYDMFLAKKKYQPVGVSSAPTQLRFVPQHCLSVNEFHSL